MAAYIADMLSPLGEVRIKRMFGEYCFYVNEKPVGFLCDNEVLVKTNAEMRALHPEMPQKLLFDGAVNPMWLIDNPDDREAVERYFGIAAKMLPAPKPKKPRALKKPLKTRKYRDGEGSPLNDPAVMGEGTRENSD
jgi:hypothetical protein